MNEKTIQISRAETDLWKLVSEILKIAEGEKGTLRVTTIDCKDNYVLLKITKEPKEVSSQQNHKTSRDAKRGTLPQKPYTTTH